MPDRPDLYDLPPEDLQRFVEQLGEPSYRSAQIRSWLARAVDDPRMMTNLSIGLRDRIYREVAPPPTVVEVRAVDGGSTQKLLIRFADGEAIETVLMRYPKRTTLCVSTQAGCAMGCPFCATGQAGLRRQLSGAEIIRQVVAVHQQFGERVDNVVFMGMGEPLGNLSATLRAVQWLRDDYGMGARHITVSTVGLVPGIETLAAAGIPVTLALSLHAGNDELRDQLVPINRVHPLESLIRAAEHYRLATNRRVSLEWCLIKDINDSARDADELAAIARRLSAHVNVIPMNPTPGVQWQEPPPAVVDEFKSRLEDAGVNVTVRDTRGREAEAACGQLMAQYHLDAGNRLKHAEGAVEGVERLTAVGTP